MSAITILKAFVRDSNSEAIERFQNYKLSYLGLFVTNVFIRLPSSHLWYDSSIIFYQSSVSIILQICIFAFMANLIVSKIAIDENRKKNNLSHSTFKFLKGQVLYYGASAIGFIFLIVPALLALYYFSLTPFLEIIEEHKGVSSLKRSISLIKKDTTVVFILLLTNIILFIIQESLFSHLRTTASGIVIYLLGAMVSTYISVILTLTYIRVVTYLKEVNEQP